MEVAGEAATDSLMSKDYHDDDAEYMAQHVEERLWREKVNEKEKRKASEIH